MTAPMPDCKRCPALVQTRKCIVEGEGALDPLIIFVGDGPGEVDDTRRRPMQGAPGKVLKVLEWAAGITPDITYHTNATRCWGKRKAKPIEIDNCHEFLIKEILEIQPAVVVALGAPALRSLYKKGVSIRSVMGFSLYHDDLPGIPIIPTYAPSYLMRQNWNDTALVIAHLRKAKRIADQGGLELKLGSYMGIETLEDLRALRDYLLNDPAVKQIAVDTETTGLSWLTDELLCVSLSGEKGTGYSVPLMHRGEVIEMVPKGRGKNKTMVEKVTYRPEPYWDLEKEMPEVLAILGEILGSPIPKSGQNISFDLRMLERRPDEIACTALTAFGFTVNNVTDDTRLASQLLQETLPASLTVLTAYWTDMPYYEEELEGFKNRMWELPDKVVWEYGGADVDVVQIVKPILLPKLKQEGSDWVYNNLAIPLIRCSTALEERGVRIDLEYFDKLCRYYRDQLEGRVDDLTDIVGKVVDSPTYYEHAQQLLFVDMDLPLTNSVIDSALKGDADGKRCSKCKKDNPCSAKHAGTSADALRDLNERHPHPVLPVFIDIKELEKFSCVVPGTPVLTRDLQWVPVETLDVGDSLLGFEEHLSTQTSRTWKEATVTHTGSKTAELFELCLSTGEVLTSSAEHPWLVVAPTYSPKQIWMTTQELADKVAKGQRFLLPQLLAPWSPSKQDEVEGYLAAAFDGDGYFGRANKRGALQLSFGQNQNAMLDQVKEYLTKKEFPFAVYDRQKCVELKILGGWPVIARFLGQIRPRRLLEKWAGMDIRVKVASKHQPEILSITSIGQGEVITLSTSTKTYIVQGYGSHNSTFLDGGKSGGLKRHIRPDERVHPRWNEARAKTGRFSCEEPNLMNPPKEKKIHSEEYGIYSDDAIRSMFIAREGYMVMNADWSQLEVWVLAYVTKDPILLGLLLGGKDAHIYVARKLCELGVSTTFPKESWEPDLSDDEWHRKYKDLRGKAKTFTFGLMYQLTEQGAADRLGCTIEESHLLFQAFLTQVFPSLPDFFNSVREEILTKHGVRNHFGRWRHLAEVPVLSALANGPRYRAALESCIRQGTNFPIQSGGHDLHTLAHIRQESQLLGGGLPVLEMHDSLMLETPKEDIEASAWAVKNGWEDLAINLTLPDGSKLDWHIPVEVTWGPSFGDPEFRLTAGGVIEKVEAEAA